MQRRFGCLLLALAVVATGCVAPVTTGERPVGAAQDPGTAVESDSLAAATGTPGSNQTVVAVEAAGDAVTPVDSVSRAVEYWEGDGTPGDGYVVVPDVADPDVIVRVASEPVRCEPGASAGGGDDRDFYCLERADGGERPATVVLSPGLTEEGYVSAAAAGLGQLAGAADPFARPDLEEPRFADPWPSSDPVTVTIDNGASPDRDFESLVRQAISYWEANDERWGTYAADWEVVDDPDADVTVSVVDEVESCGDHPDPGGLIGCAPVRGPDSLADGDEHVRVVGGYDDETTLLILKHEFGHLYGVSHGEEPADVMVDRISTTPLAD